VTVDRLPDSAAGRPLAAFIDATQGAVPMVQDVDEPDTGYRAIARLSGHLAAMWLTVYPQTAGRLGADGQLRAVCLRRGREVEWALRLFQCQLSGEVSAVRRSAASVLTLLAQRLDSYRSAEQALVTWLEDQLAAEGRDKLARKYRRALAHAPTRPHPRCPRSGPLGHAGFWLHGRWDRVLDTMDSRPGVGFGFPVPLADRSPVSSAGEGDGDAPGRAGGPGAQP
jgi:hypothetical protein